MQDRLTLEQLLPGTDEKLLSQVHEHNEAFLPALRTGSIRQAKNDVISIAYADHSGWIRSKLTGWIGDRERADDLCQETMIRAYRHLHTFNFRKKFSSWAYIIASNLRKNELRNRSKSRVVLLQTLSKNREEEQGQVEFPSTYDTARAFQQRDLQRVVQDGIAVLPEQYGQVVRLRELQGMSYEDISARIGIPLGTVKTRIHRGRNALAEWIEREHPDYGPGWLLSA